MAICNSYGIPKPDIHGALGHAKLLKIAQGVFRGRIRTRCESSRRKDHAMKHLTTGTLVAAALVAAASGAAADSSSIGVGIISDRDPGNFGDPKNTKYEINGAYTFDSGLIFGGSFQYTDTTFSDRTTQNLEGTIGYRVPLNPVFSLTGSVGIGEHWRQDPNTDFPYYVLRIAADFKLSQAITWNVVSYRFREGFDRNDDYDTPQIATGLTFNLADQRSISAKIIRNWKGGEPSSTGVSLGFKQGF
jgi:opacity protein-like surface antigen